MIEKDERVAALIKKLRTGKEWSKDGYEVWENYAWDLRTVKGKSGQV